MTSPAQITCPACGRTSQHPIDLAEGYCGACHDWTSQPAASRRAPKQEPPATPDQPQHA